MASAFWILEDGRTFSRRWEPMSHALNFIITELKEIDGAGEFYEYLKRFVFREEEGDEPNGIGGFIRDNESVMLNFDLRSFAPKNREFFWQATQRALLKIQNDKSNDAFGLLLSTLLEMHSRIEKGEDPMLQNDTVVVQPPPTDKVGPGW